MILPGIFNEPNVGALVKDDWRNVLLHDMIMYDCMHCLMCVWPAIESLQFNGTSN